jgi:hypothetical protein
MKDGGLGASVAPETSSDGVRFGRTGPKKSPLRAGLLSHGSGSNEAAPLPARDGLKVPTRTSP